MTVRVLGAIWVSTLLMIGAFAFMQIRDERARLVVDLQRRAVLVADGLRDSVEPLARRGAAPAIERQLKRLARANRRIAVYDAFGSAVAIAPEPDGGALPASLPEVTEPITANEMRRGFRMLDGRKTYVYAVPSGRMAGRSVHSQCCSMRHIWMTRRRACGSTTPCVSS